MKKLIVLLSLLLSITSSGYMNLYPTSFHKRIDGKGASEEFVLYNPGVAPVKYRIYSEENKKNGQKSLVSWMEIYPQNITLKPGEEKRVKLYIKAPSSAKEDEYSGIIGFKEIHVPSGSISKESSLKILTDLKLHITGYVGDIQPELKGENISFSSKGLTGLLINHGKRRADIEIYLADKSKKNLFYLTSSKIPRGGKEDISRIKLSEKLPEDIEIYDKILIIEKNTHNHLGEFVFN